MTPIFNSSGHQLLSAHLSWSHFSVPTGRDLSSFDVPFSSSPIFISSAFAFQPGLSGLPLHHSKCPCLFNFLSQPLSKVSTMEQSNQYSFPLLHRLLRAPRKFTGWCSGRISDASPDPHLSPTLSIALSPLFVAGRSDLPNSLFCCQPSPHLITSFFILSRWTCFVPDRLK